MNSNKGFTLIELLIVIAVLGILLSIAAPRLSGVAENARDEGLRTTAVSLQKSIELHLTETNLFPNSDDTTFDFANSSIDFQLGDAYEVDGLDSYDSNDKSYTVNLYELNNEERTGRSALITKDSITVSN